MLREPEILVLLSGGIDSAACVDFYRSLGRPLCALHVDYGQAASRKEYEAAVGIAHHYRVHLCQIHLAQSREKGVGEIAGRNGFLIFSAIMERPASVTAIALGVHAGTGYSDCSQEFLTRLN